MASTSTNAIVKCSHGSDRKCVRCDDRITQYETAKFMHSSADVFNEAELNEAYARAALLPAHKYKLMKWITYVTLATLFVSFSLVWYMVYLATMGIGSAIVISAGFVLITYEVTYQHRN